MANASMEEFEALLNESFEMDTPDEGTVVKGKVIAVEAGQAIIDVGYKMEGRVELKEFANPGEAPEIEVGDEVVDRVTAATSRVSARGCNRRYEGSAVAVAPDTVLTNAEKLAAIFGGGTNCSAPLAKLNKERAEVDLVLIVSDNQSWMDARSVDRTGLMAEWTKLKARNHRAKLVCIDIQPYGTTQAPESDDVLNVGGFSDAVFEVIEAFASGNLGAARWVGEIEKIALE